MEWSGEKQGRFTREEKGKAVLVDEDTVVSTNGSDFVDLNLRLGNGVENPVDTTVRFSDVDDSPEEIGLTTNLNERVDATISRDCENCKQGNRLVEEYINEFIQLNSRNLLLDNENMQIARFQAGLKLKIKEYTKMINTFTLGEAFDMA
ncbi:hypothetical protein LWI28_022726 [Acer negundo]|uniref:Uncharacterized protein n=1 Tax=Acer negundo TaxID=4023 RepID=A0AAD5J7V4_ACENE|nr:hypothetical protein LWI28_022726 [Acer negundo]